MSVDFIFEKYNPILQQVIRWRVLPLPLLKELSHYQGLDTSFRKVIQKLEKVDLVSSRSFNGKSKLVYLGDELIKSCSEKIIPIHDESLVHEAVVSIVSTQLLTHGLFSSVKLPHEVVTSNYDFGIRRLPDAVFEGKVKSDIIRLALEVELTRKAKLRVKNKIEDYLTNRVFDYIFYLFNDEAIYNSYKNILLDFQKSSDSKTRHESEIRFILGFQKDILHKGINLSEVEIFYKGKKTSFNNVFRT